MKQFCFSNRRKAFKKASFCLVGKLPITKIRFLFESGYFENRLIFSTHLETGHFSNQGSVDNKFHLQSNDAQ